MAVSANKIMTTLVLKVKTGVVNGKDTMKSLSFNKVKAGATDEDIFAVASGIAGVLAYPISNVNKQDVNELING